MAIHSIYSVDYRRQEHSLLREGVIVVASSILIALAARLSLPLPFTPIPFAMPAQVCLFLAVLLGPKLAVRAVLLYLAQGAVGLPVFVFGGGLPILLGPTGGYLAGYALGALVTGVLVERLKHKTLPRLFFCMLVGNVILFGMGMAWLSQWVGWERVWMCGAAPFLVGDALKLVLVASLLRGCRFIPRC